MASQEIVQHVEFEDIHLVIRQINRKQSRLYVGASIYFPDFLKKDKIIIGLNEAITNILEQSSKLQQGDLMQLKHQIYGAKIDAHSAKLFYNLDFGEYKDVPIDFECFLIQSPLDLNGDRESIFIKDGKQQNVDKVTENLILCQYQLFDDYVDYYKVNEKNKRKRQKKRTLDQMQNENENEGPNNKKRKIMAIEEEIKQNDENKELESAEIRKNETEEIRCEELKQSEIIKPPKVSDKEEMSYDEEENKEEELSTQDKEIIEILNDSDFVPTPQDLNEEMELKRKHLFMPEEILSNPNRLLQFSGNDVIRIIYDSEDGNVDNFEDGNEEDQNLNIQTSMEELIDDVQLRAECAETLKISECGLYWVQSKS